MTPEPSITVIVAMALVTFATRAGGYWLVRWLPEGSLLERWLAAIPGAVLIAMVAPGLAAGDWAIRLGAVATFAVMVFARNMALAALTGIAAVAGLRYVAGAVGLPI